MEEIRDKRGRTEAEAIAQYRAKNYPKPAVTADVAVFARRGGAWTLLLIRRGGHPFLGCWALPGGFADPEEPLEITAERELREETGLTGQHLRLVGVYSAPGRDPRGWVVSAAYAVCTSEELAPVAADDAAEVRWVTLTRDASGALIPALPEGERLAFDHGKIIADAIACLRDRLTGDPVR